jgi:hypothetical protein
VRRALPLVLCLTGCLPDADPRAPSDHETPAPLARTGNAWADCYRRFQPSDDPSADLARLAQACAAPAGLVPVGLPITGSQTAHERVERFSFRARKGRCYRAFAVGAPGVRDLDVAFFDAAGSLVTADVSRDRWPVVPPRGPLCAERDQLYSVVVTVTRGGGDYVVQIWGSPREEER